MTAAIDHKRLFDAIRQVKGSGLTQDDVAAINAVLGGDRPLSPPSVAEFFGETITSYEGVLSMRPTDNGNYQGGKRGDGALVGSQYGVTAPALAAFRGVSKYAITNADIKAITRDLAVQIGVKLYYHVPRFDLLPWNRVVASIVDKAWGSGPERAIKLMQRMVGTTPDGELGQATASAFVAWLAAKGEEAAASEWADVRLKFDASLGQPEYLNGWNSRTRSFLPGGIFWKGWLR